MTRVPTTQTVPQSLIVDQLPVIGERLSEILGGHGVFDDIYRRMLATPGKRVRAGLVLATAQLGAGVDAVSVDNAVDIACAIEMLHESSLVHDDICDGSVLRRDAPSVASAFGIRIAARAGFHLAGTALAVLASVIDGNQETFGNVGRAPGVTYLDQLSDLSFGQLIETMSSEQDGIALRRHYRLVASAKTGTLFRLACTYGGTAGAVDEDGLRSLMIYADELAVAFQIMDDVRDIEGGPSLGKDACGDLDRRVPTWPVIEWLGSGPVARGMWLDESMTGAQLQAELLRTGATDAARSVAIDATATACSALDMFEPSSAREHLRELCISIVTR